MLTNLNSSHLFCLEPNACIRSTNVGSRKGTYLSTWSSCVKESSLLLAAMLNLYVTVDFVPPKWCQFSGPRELVPSLYKWHACLGDHISRSSARVRLLFLVFYLTIEMTHVLTDWLVDWLALTGLFFSDFLLQQNTACIRKLLTSYCFVHQIASHQNMLLT